MDIKIGSVHTKSTVVTPDNVAAKNADSLPAVFSTPSMIALMEVAARECVQPYLPKGQVTVGKVVNIVHSAATPIGRTVTAKATLTAVDRKELTFDVVAYTDDGIIGSGIHSRFIVNTKEFENNLK